MAGGRNHAREVLALVEPFQDGARDVLAIVGLRFRPCLSEHLFALALWGAGADLRSGDPIEFAPAGRLNAPSALLSENLS